MRCIHCHSEQRQIKNGRNKSGSQRYKCRSCSRTYTPLPAARKSFRLTSVEICAGGGGQALGLEQAGFHHLALVEIDATCCKTLKLNRPEWNVVESDIKSFDITPYRGVDLLSGGVPCPPFSVAGKKLGEHDERNLFDDAIRLAEICRPKAIMIENVKGLLEAPFASYRTRVVEKIESLGYTCFWKLLNASDYAVPQLRPRSVFVALLPEYAAYFAWPAPTTATAPTVGDVLYDEMRRCGWRGAEEWRYRANTIAPTLVGGSKKHGGPDLGPTRAKQAWAKLGVNGHSIAEAPPPHDFEGMPRLTVRMAATLQGFPSDWQFAGKKTAAYRQVGNAFPPPVAKAVGEAIARALLKVEISRNGKEKCLKGSERKQSFAPTF